MFKFYHFLSSRLLSQDPRLHEPMLLFQNQCYFKSTILGPAYFWLFMLVHRLWPLWLAVSRSLSIHLRLGWIYSFSGDYVYSIIVRNQLPISVSSLPDFLPVFGASHAWLPVSTLMGNWTLEYCSSWILNGFMHSNFWATSFRRMCKEIWICSALCVLWKSQVFPILFWILEY